LDISLAGYLANPDLKDYSIGNLADYFLKVVVPKREKPKQTSLFEDSQDDEKDDVLEKELRAAFMLKGFFDEKFDLTSRDESANTAPDSADSKLHDSADSMSHSFTQTIATVNDDKVLLNDIELPIACLLASMEKTGILADRGVLGSISGALAEKVADAAENAMACLDNQSVNLNSPKQLQKVLFEDLGMPRTKKTKTGYTTNQEALEQLFVQTRHPFLQNLLAFRESTKQKQIVDGFLESVRMDGKIHTTYQQTGAATGRLSSKEPNLQNVPAKTEDSAKVRAAFVASQGYDFLISADYSQIEMRIMAHLSGDASLIEAFKNNEDLHAFVAAQVFGVPLDAVTKEERRKVKAVSYGLSYGLSSFGLSQQLKISVSEASHIIDKYYERFGGVRDYLQSVVKFARMDGWTSTILGRKRYFDGFSSHNRMVQQATERAALNSPIQGSAADIIKIAMLEVSKAFREAGLKSRILLQVHDELIIETTADELDTARQILVDKMERSPRIKDLGLKVPLRVSVGVGKNWLEAAH
jgi:DNA polymerase-1